MEVKKDVVEPIVNGTIATAILMVLDWILTLLGFAPFTAFVVNLASGPGILGLIASMWVLGYSIPEILKAVEDLLK